MGSASFAARKLKSDRATIMPARNAPSSIDTPKSIADPTAIPSATTSTVSVKSSRDPVSATLARSHGMTRPPIGSATAMRRPIFSTASPRAIHRPPPPPPESMNMTGNITRTSTVNRSSTTSHPTAMCPVGVWSSLLSDNTRTRTTVLATDRASPNTTPAAHPHPMTHGQAGPEASRNEALKDRAGHRDAAHREKFLDVEVQPDPEHEQNHADIGKLLGEMRVGLEAGRVLADDDPREEISDDGRQPEPVRDVPKHEGRAERAGQRQDKFGVVHSDMLQGRKE